MFINGKYNQTEVVRNKHYFKSIIWKILNIKYLESPKWNKSKYFWDFPFNVSEIIFWQTGCYISSESWLGSRIFHQTNCYLMFYLLRISFVIASNNSLKWLKFPDSIFSAPKLCMVPMAPKWLSWGKNRDWKSSAAPGPAQMEEMGSPCWLSWHLLPGNHYTES